MIRSRDARFVEDEVPFVTADPRSTAASPIVPAQEDLIILATSQNPVPAAPQAAGPHTPARAPPALPVGPVRAAQIRNITVTPPPQPVFVRENAPSPPAPVAPPSPLPAPPSDEVDVSQDGIDFLGKDPFGATLAGVKALYSAASDNLSASETRLIREAILIARVGSSQSSQGHARLRLCTLAQRQAQRVLFLDR
ncbi:hypothetical protein JCM10908_002213 [Rhodotorula pacifica]|uniref:uncharacterized protein n=1 Tax=Rhodotorula pacifica TaxID=1495444 RepID=UPI0031781AC6